MQGKIISEVLHAVWFDSGKASQGVVFENLFNPIPFETLALIMTIVSFRLCSLLYISLTLTYPNCRLTFVLMSGLLAFASRQNSGKRM